MVYERMPSKGKTKFFGKAGAVGLWSLLPFLGLTILGPCLGRAQNATNPSVTPAAPAAPSASSTPALAPTSPQTSTNPANPANPSSPAVPAIPGKGGTNDALTTPPVPTPSGAPEAATAAPPTSPDSTNSAAAMEMTAAMEKLREEGKLTNNRAVSAAVRKVINDNSEQHELSAPMGAKVIAVHKHPGDLVRVGDKIVTLLVEGKQVPILAKQEGVMQAINVSKGGIIGNSRPRAAKVGSPTEGSILMTLRPIHSHSPRA